MVVLREALIQGDKAVPSVPPPGKLQQSVSHNPAVLCRMVHDALVDSFNI